MINLLDLNPDRLTSFLESIGEKPFRARQLLRWVHQLGADDFGLMTDLPKALRERLEGGARVVAPPAVREEVSPDGTVKWLLDTGAGNAVETVFIPEAERGTLCVSSQVGCALECSFCATGRQGFNRNLSAGEIIGQLWHANRALGAGPGRRPVTNVVLMGMGEPLLNFENVVTALELMLDDLAYGLSRRRVTVSTSGIVPHMDRLRERCPVALAVSLHAPGDGLRNELVPINRKWPLRELMAACERYLEVAAREPDAGARGSAKWQRWGAPRDFITFEYVMLEGVNDDPAHARELLALTRDVPCKFNLIPFNPFVGSAYRRSPPARIAAFQEVLMAAGVIATVRKTRGETIDAACGQLAGRVQERRRRQQRPAEAAH